MKIMFQFITLCDGGMPEMRNRYLSTNSVKLCRIGYPARRIRIVSIMPEYRSWRQQSPRSNICAKHKSTFNSQEFVIFLLMNSSHVIYIML